MKRVLSLILAIFITGYAGSPMEVWAAEPQVMAEKTEPADLEEQGTDRLSIRGEGVEEAQAQIRAAGSSFSGATGISTGVRYSGSMTAANSADYYRFTLESSGRISLAASAGMEWVYYAFYNINGERLWSTRPQWNGTTRLSSVSETLDLIKGTYYFVVERYDGCTGSYSFQTDFTGAGESFTEEEGNDNNSLEKAAGIALNTDYAGQIALNDSKDFYKFTLPSSGRISLTASAGMKWVYYAFYNIDGECLWSIRPEWNGTTRLSSVSETLDLIKGTYYFVVERYDGRTGNYSFRTDFAEAGESFMEGEGRDNNSLEKAENISLNETYAGQIALNDSRDFYKFTLDSAGRINLNAVAKMEWITYAFYSGDGRRVWSINPHWNDSIREVNIAEHVDLSAGTYYFVVEKDRGCTGNYAFCLEKHVHKYEEKITKATLSRDGKIERICVCGASEETTVIYRPAKYYLTAGKCIYDGKVKKPVFGVLDSRGKIISPSNYTVKYSGKRKNVGTYGVKFVLKKYYSGVGAGSFVIYPKGTEISKLAGKSGGFTVKWKKQKAQVTGYQVQYALNPKFSGGKIVTISGNSKTSATYKKLKKSKQYYVRVRTYKIVSGKKYDSGWSKAKTVRTGK